MFAYVKEKQYVAVDLGSLEKNAQKYFSEELPDAFYASMKTMDNKQLGELQYDFLVMDEGQDILKPNYLYCLDFLLKGGFDKGRWAVFYDEKPARKSRQGRCCILWVQMIFGTA